MSLISLHVFSFSCQRLKTVGDVCLRSLTAFSGKRRQTVPLYRKKCLWKTKDLLPGEPCVFLQPCCPARMEAAPTRAWTANRRKASSLRSAVKMVSTSAVRVLKVRGNERSSHHNEFYKEIYPHCFKFSPNFSSRQECGGILLLDVYESV